MEQLEHLKVNMAATGGFNLIEVPMGNRQHEQKFDKLHILIPNCMYMITGLFMTKFRVCNPICLPPQSKE